MAGLGIWDGSIPPYSSVFIVELHELQPGDFIYKILYKKDTLTNQYSEPIQIQLKGI